MESWKRKTLTNSNKGEIIINIQNLGNKIYLETRINTMRINRFLTSQTMRCTLSRQKSGSQREINVLHLTLVIASLRKTEKHNAQGRKKCLAFVLLCHCGFWSRLVEESTVSYICSEFKNSKHFFICS